MGDQSNDAKAILAACPDHIGLWVSLGCGRADTAGLLPELAAGGDMLVHGLALDDASLARVRDAIHERGMAGRAMAEKLVGRALPYLPNLARTVVVEDMASLEAAGITREEVLRVLAPGGTLCENKGGKWTATVKPRPEEMDEWTHPHHGPDGNMASSDRAVSFPIDFRWIDGVPFDRGGFGACASCRAVVLAGGRCFSVNIDDLANVGSGAADAWLLARDAWSGLPIWKFNCEGTYGKVELDWRNVWPLVATDTRVYTARKTDLVILDAATGRLVAACPTKFQPRRLILANDCLVAACWETMELSNPKDGFENDGIRSVWWPGKAGTVEVFDPQTGKPRWSLPLAALTIVSGDGLLYVLTHKGNPPTERELIAVELATGKEKWRVPHTAFGEEPDTCLNFAVPGGVVVSKSKAKGKREVFVLSAEDGKMRFRVADSTARTVVGQELWCTDGRYDLKSGEKNPGPGIGGTYAGVNVVGGCVPPIVVGEKYITASRSGSYLQLPESSQDRPVKLSYGGARGACLMGMLPANGMFYTAQNNCGCFPAQIGGFLAVGPFGNIPGPEEFLKPRPVEKGPAFGATGPATAAEDWPTYRHNEQRSGGISADMPDGLRELWKVQCTKPADTPSFAEAWNARIGVPQPLTAPIAAAGRVFVASLDRGEVMAIDPANGTIAWAKGLASRIDSAPTYYKGLLLVGCHDGWVYALRAKDGELAYRIQVAPGSHRMVAHGAVESPWPATGSVLIYNDVAYVTAGRSTQALGGIALVAFEPQTGRTVWAKHLDEKFRSLNDILVIRDGELAWHWFRMDPRTGEDLPPDQRYYAHSGILDGAWISGFGKRSGGGFMLGRMCEGMMAWNDKLVVVPSYAVAREKADAPKPAPNARAKHPDRFKPEETAWRTNLEPHIEWARVYAMALTGNTAYYAGSVLNGWANNRYDGSFLWMKSTADGKTRQKEIKLQAAPCYDAMAVSGGQLYLALQDGTLVCWGK